MDQLQALTLPYMAQVLAYRGTLDVFSLDDEFLQLVRRIEDLQVLVPALAASALISQLRGKVDIGVRLIDELTRLTLKRWPWRSRHLPVALRVLIAAGKLEEAKSFTNGIKVTATRDCNCVLTGQAILAEAKGHMDDSRRLYQEAAHRWADYGFVLEEGQAHLGLGRCLIAVGDREAASEPLHKARAIFARLGARPLSDEVDRHLGPATAQGA